jgi:hypothetical protein
MSCGFGALTKEVRTSRWRVKGNLCHDMNLPRDGRISCDQVISQGSRYICAVDIHEPTQLTMTIFSGKDVSFETPILVSGR